VEWRGTSEPALPHPAKSLLWSRPDHGSGHAARASLWLAPSGVPTTADLLGYHWGINADRYRLTDVTCIKSKALGSCEIGLATLNHGART
jgi:hypothetical protein